MRIRDLMTTDVLTVGPGASLKEAARRMLEAGISGMPVTEDGDLIGIITEADFVASEAERRSESRAGLLRFLHRDEDVPSQERRVGDVMTTNVVTIDPEADHSLAARLMQSKRVKRIPVVENDRLVGLVSRADILKPYTRSDSDIIDEITEDVMRKILWIDPGRVTVRSVEGNVALTGQLETKSDTTLLAELTMRLDGVTSVKNELSYEVDNTKLEMTSPPMGFPKGNWW